MREILGKAKTVRELLKGVKYSIDYYQREYGWHDKQIRELVDDLSGKFLEDYQPDHERSKVADYPRYFLGSIIISKKDGGNFIVDGQQRLTSLTLLLILLRNLQRDRPKQVNIDELIFSEKFDQKSFNIHVDERTPAMEALFDDQLIDVTDRPESVQNLVQRYRDLEEAFPDDLRGDALPYFIDWLLENVHLVEITAYSDDDAYTIFETMNDRGLSLSPTDMLKGYLLANMNEQKRTAANSCWRDRIRVTESIDTTSSGGRLIFHIFGALAEFERSIIRERTTAGLTAARARGRVGGRPPALSESDLRVAQTLLKDGELTVAEIAERLHVAPSTLYKHLPRPRSSTEDEELSALRS